MTNRGDGGEAKEVLDRKRTYRNHGGFGEYDQQKGDGDMTLSDQKQIEITVTYSLDFLKDL